MTTEHGNEVLSGKPEAVQGQSSVQTTDPIMQYFEYAHLPERLQAVSRPFGELAHQLVQALPRNPERTVALRKLLESKDAAVRAALAR